MYRLTVASGLLMLCLAASEGQGPVDFNTFNKETYRLYTQQKWDSLIDMGKTGLRLDYDYYYLRMRLGIACYTKKNYRKAADHFTRALGFNQDDPAALEYLYYSRLLSGNREQSDQVSKRFRGALAGEIPPPRGRFLDRLSLEYAFQKGAAESLFENPAEVYPTGLAGVQYTTRHFSNVSLTLTNRLAPGITLTHGFNYLYKSNHYFTGDGLTMLYSPEQHTIQHQYYLSPRFTTPSGTVLIPMVHLIRLGTQYYWNAGSGYMGGATDYVSGYAYDTDVITGMGFLQGIGRFDLHLGAWYGRLNGAEQVQGRAGVTWYPLGNLNLYTACYLNSHYETVPGREAELRLVPELLLGFGIAEKLWFEAEAEKGDMNNYLESYGMIVYNSFGEVIEKKVRLSLSAPVSRKGSLLYLGGKWSANRSVFYPSDPSTIDPGTIIQYHSLSIYGGLSWKF